MERPVYISHSSTPNAKIQSISPDRLKSSSTTNQQNVTKNQPIRLEVPKSSSASSGTSPAQSAFETRILGKEDISSDSAATKVWKNKIDR